MSAANVHDISQPLAAMEATLAAAEIGLAPGDAPTATRIDKARGLVRRMQRTTKHLKSFAKRDRESLGTAVVEVIDLRDVAANALELVAPRARAVGVVPHLSLPEAPVPARAGPVRMEQVCVNLLLNALDAVEGRAGAEVRLELGPGPELRVVDNGPGIAEADLPRVAEPFFSTKLTGEGLGLGLSISRAIVEEFGGQMSIAAPPGGGTTVTVRLPDVTPAREAAE